MGAFLEFLEKRVEVRLVQCGCYESGRDEALIAVGSLPNFESAAETMRSELHIIRVILY